MKIELGNCHVAKISTLADSTIQLKINLQELPPEDMVKLFQSLNSDLHDIEFDPNQEGKTPSKRLRAALFVLWEQQYKEKFPDFPVFYDSQMTRLIEKVKDKID